MTEEASSAYTVEEERSGDLKRECQAPARDFHEYDNASLVLDSLLQIVVSIEIHSITQL